jgi:histidinol phosphatase-like enzyme (inositol monophosphatase family)
MENPGDGRAPKARKIAKKEEKQMTGQLLSLDDEIVTKALVVASDAARTVRQYFRRGIQVQFKPDDSPVTLADKTVETQIRAALARDFPGHGILGEEHGVRGKGLPDMWIVDPIDGTKSFISGHPLFGMLLGLTRNDLPALGVVSMPELEETYVGVPGIGARLNGRDISTSSCASLANAILYINEAEKIFAAEEAVFRTLSAAGRMRRMAYDCYPHALLAAGHVDVVVDYDLKPYDFLPVAALVKGAGGLMTDWEGRELHAGSDGRVLSAATRQLHTQMLELLGENGA